MHSGSPFLKASLSERNAAIKGLSNNRTLLRCVVCCCVEPFHRACSDDDYCRERELAMSVPSTLVSSICFFLGNTNNLINQSISIFINASLAGSNSMIKYLLHELTVYNADPEKVRFQLRMIYTSTNQRSIFQGIHILMAKINGAKSYSFSACLGLSVENVNNIFSGFSPSNGIFDN